MTIRERIASAPAAAAGRVHLSGIGGIAMATLAAMLVERGYSVTGSDAAVYPPASDLLRAAGITPQEGYRAENLQPPPDWVVIGNALSRGNAEVEYVLDHKIPYRSLPATVEEFFLPGHRSIVIAGTHGKTSTTSLLAWILHAGGRRPNFLVGGMVQDFGSSYRLGGGEEFVIEGDEYDSAFFDKAPKFLHYHPDELVITSLEFDHADIYPDLAAIDLQFRRLVNLVPRAGRIVLWGESRAVAAAAGNAFCPVERYGLSGDCEWIADQLEFTADATRFRVRCRGRELGAFAMPLAGRHNVLNALAAIAIASGRGVAPESIARALATFRGVRRRLELRGEARGVLVLDDFAHHPTAVRETIAAARARWPGRRLWAAFEPRSNTMRRRILENELAAALADADAAILGPVNRPQLLPEDQRMDPARVVRQLAAAGRPAWAFDSAAEIPRWLSVEARPGDLVLVLSNGNFDGLCDKLLEALRR
ncbi:MAG TPA: UDP-N-acetylmuramate:L-alanyl-gamma-D-glutamyl-meso-diaminopimelate ligase [Candidatus Acidoferrales bacterium]|nr:UDP-N-acetylmuramate:L-alanyl-gamma-D-glutamyl-meso-diaminopimelate ligase [Candidatus Acidoferrales bacterium]